MTAFARSIIAIEEHDNEAEGRVLAGFALVRTSSNFNNLVRAYRAHPELRTSLRETKALGRTRDRYGSRR